MYVVNSVSAQKGISIGKGSLINTHLNGFYENKGQIVDQNYKPNTQVKYLLSTPGFNVQLRQTGFSYDTYTEEVHPSKDSESFSGKRKFQLPAHIFRSYHRVDVELAGCNPYAFIEAEKKSEAYYNYFTAGTPDEGVSYVHYYQKVTYKDIYPYIDLVFFATDGTLVPVEYNFIVHPGGNPADIKLQYKGADKVFLAHNRLIVTVQAGNFNENIPSSYWAGTKQPVEVGYTSMGKNSYGFLVPDYKISNSNNDLIIDPTPCLTWGTYYGGTGGDEAYGIALDASNNTYITGYTSSASGIATAGAYKTSFTSAGITNDAFVAKFNSTGASILWGTYYGGAGNDLSYGIALDASNNVYIVGQTNSTTGISTAGAYQTTFGGGTEDVFVAEFNSTGSSRVWGSYYGGASADFGTGIALDASNNVCITGYTFSSSGIATAGVHQTSLSGTGSFSDAFVAKLNSTGTSLLWGTYYGGTENEQAYGISIDASANVYITGYTLSTSGIATSGTYQTSLSGTGSFSDAFVAKLNSTGSLVWGTYYGGTSNEEGYALTLDASNNVYVTGWGTSTTGVTTVGAYKTSYSGSGLADVFVAKFSSTGTNLDWGTYYGGTGTDEGCGITIDPSNNVYITGATGSATDIASSGAYQTSLSGSGTTDVFIASFNSSGTSLNWGTYYGGASDDNGQGILLDASNNVRVAGYTASSSSIASGGYQTTLGGGSYDAFVAEFGCNVVPLPVSLLNFNCNANDGMITLNWATASETNNKEFTIERSSDGLVFTKIATIAGRGNSDVQKVYQYNDHEPLSGDNYYNLIQTDYDGNSTTFNTTVCNVGNEDFKIYPNPSNGAFTILYPESFGTDASRITVTNLLGQQVYTQLTSGNIQKETLNVPFLTPGIYILSIASQSTQYTTKVIINK